MDQKSQTTFQNKFCIQKVVQLLSGWTDRPSTRCPALQKPKATVKFLVYLCVCLPVDLCPGDFVTKRFLCPCRLKRKRQCCDFMPLTGKGASILEFAWSALCPKDFLQKGSCPPVCVDALSFRSRGPRKQFLAHLCVCLPVALCPGDLFSKRFLCPCWLK